MKKGILLVAVATIIGVSFTSCENKKNKLWDSNAMVSLRAADANKSSKATSNGHWSAREIVEKTTDLIFYNPAFGDAGRAFGYGQRDLINERLLMNGSDIISDGKYINEFIEAQDILFVVINIEESIITDTVAYLPNKTVSDAQKIIKPAFEAGEYDLVYETFENAFRFIPITGAEWLELKRQGKN